jgi:hypothetical protein
LYFPFGFCLFYEQRWGFECNGTKKKKKYKKGQPTEWDCLKYGLVWITARQKNLLGQSAATI